MQNYCYESEKQLEENLLRHLVADGYEKVFIPDIEALKSNFRKQITKHNIRELNGVELSDQEFERLLNQIEGKNVFNSAKNLRQKQVIKRDDGSDLYIELFNSKDWCKNEFQVTHQINNNKGKYVNRYDVTILINGLPLVQIELKRRGIDFKEAFDQAFCGIRTNGGGVFALLPCTVFSCAVSGFCYADCHCGWGFGICDNGICLKGGNA